MCMRIWWLGLLTGQTQGLLSAAAPASSIILRRGRLQQNLRSTEEVCR